MVGRFQWGSCGSIFSFLCYGWQTFSGVPVAQSFVFCVMVGRPLVGFVWLDLQFSVSWLVDFQWGSCGSIFSFLCHGWQTFSGVRVAQSLVFCVMVGRLLVVFVWLNLQLSVSWLGNNFQWGSCGSIFSFLCHGWQPFSGVRVAQSLDFCVMVGRFQWGSCGSIFSFLCYGWQTFSGVPVAQSFVFCVMVGRPLVGFVWLNLQFSVSWLVDFQWVRVAQSLVFCVMVGRLLVVFVWLNLQLSVSWLVNNFQWGSCGSIFSFLYHGRQIFSGLRVSQSLVFCVMVGRLLVGFAWLNLQFSVSWLVDFQWGSCGSIFSFLCHGWQTFSGLRVSQSLVFCVMVDRLLVGFLWPNLLFSVSWLVDFQWGSCGSIFSFLCQGWQTFSGVRVAQSLAFCVMVGRLLVGFVWLNLFFLCHGRQTFSGLRVSQSLVFCVMVGRLLVGSCGSNLCFLCNGCILLVGFVWLNLQFCVSWLVDFQWVRVAQTLVFCVMIGRLLVGFVWLNLQFSVSWQVDFKWGSCGSIFSFLCHGWQTFSGVRVAQSLCFLFHGWQILVGFVLLNLQFSVSWQVDFQWGSCGSIFCFLCHGWQNFSGVRVAQSLVFCVMVGRLLVGFVWLNLQFSVSFVASLLVGFVWLNLQFSVSFVGRLLVGFVWLNLQFSVSWLVDFQWGSCGSIFMFSMAWLVDFWWGSCGSIFSFLCHGWYTFSGVRVAQSLVFCVMAGRLLVGFVLLNLQFSVSWLVDFQWGSCGSIFRFLCHGRYTFSGLRVSQSLVFCVIVDRLLVGFVWPNLLFSVSWLVDFQWGSCGSIFRFLCHGWQTFSGVRVAQSLVFCVMVCRLLVGFVWLNLQFSVSQQVDFQGGSCGSIFSFLCHGW